MRDDHQVMELVSREIWSELVDLDHEQMKKKKTVKLISF